MGPKPQTEEEGMVQVENISSFRGTFVLHQKKGCLNNVRSWIYYVGKDVGSLLTGLHWSTIKKPFVQKLVDVIQFLSGYGTPNKSFVVI